MAVRIVPYLVFGGNAREAIQFYADVLDGRIEGILTFGDNPFPGMPEEAENRVMHAQLTVGDSALFFSDTYPGQDHRPGNQVAVTLLVDTVEEAERIYTALAEGAQEIALPLQQTDWSPAYAQVTDKFGVPFQINTVPADQA
ncbi:VOC family protein [Symbiobacterium thermophilum]|jgi:PhnB protein|uniref:VOC family protein n=1 Tax=Symbiobacterium thermophilum TaxID=2734 RepID=UPI0002DCEB75|nr:VOC family protein [Symbiobacterium thermophilum]